MPITPAPSYEALFNFEEIFEDATAAVIAAATLPVLKARETAENAELITYCEFELGDAQGVPTRKVGLHPTTGIPFIEYERYEGSFLSITIKANRFFDAGGGAVANTDLAQVRAKIRTLFRQSQWPFHDGNLFYYRVSKLRPLRPQNGTDQSKTADYSTLRYAVDFAIMPEAWPVIV